VSRDHAELNLGGGGDAVDRFGPKLAAPASQ
jgi:hypothetical protein